MVNKTCSCPKYNTPKIIHQPNFGMFSTLGHYFERESCLPLCLFVFCTSLFCICLTSFFLRFLSCFSKVKLMLIAMFVIKFLVVLQNMLW